MAASVLDDRDVRERYLGCLRVGEPRHAAARALGLSHSQVQRYVATHPDFAAEVGDARGEGVTPLYQKAYETALGRPCSCGGGHVSMEAGLGGKPRAVLVHAPDCAFMPADTDMLKFMLKALDQETFGTKVTVEHEHHLDLASVEAMAALRERLERRQEELAHGAVLQLPASSVRD